MKNAQQRARQQRGADFQEEVRRSWRALPSLWRLRLRDGRGIENPADELVLLEDFNALAEHKRTDSDRFSLSYLRPNQVKGLQDFDGVLGRNLGLVFISFHNPVLFRDDCYVFRLVTALEYMRDRSRTYITLQEFQFGDISESGAVDLELFDYLPVVRLPRLADAKEPTYDLRGLLKWYGSL